jgi:AcrR family transcriptional regulator
MTSQDWNTRRSDARRNHERVLNAAIEVFTEQGLDATIPEIAARAGVGKATVYRSYPTKADLIRAIAELHVTQIREVIAEAADYEDAYQGLEHFITTVMSRLAHDRLMVEIFSDLSDSGAELPEPTSDPDDRHAAMMQDLLERASKAGQVRADVTEMDFKVLVGGAARSLITMEVDDPALWERYAHLALSALRP